MSKLLFISTFFICCLASSGCLTTDWSYENWVKLYGGPAKERGLAIAAYPGGFIAVGSTQSFGEGDENDALVTATDNSGNLNWDRFLGNGQLEEANDVVVDAIREVFYVGGNMGNIGFVAKYNFNGDTLWDDKFITIEKGGKIVDVKDLDLDESGNVYIIGRQYDGAGSIGYFRKIDPEGNTLREYPNNPNFQDTKDGNGCQVMASGDIYYLQTSETDGKSHPYVSFLNSHLETIQTPWYWVPQTHESAYPSGIAISDIGVFITGNVYSQDGKPNIFYDKLWFDPQDKRIKSLINGPIIIAAKGLEESNGIFKGKEGEIFIVGNTIDFGGNPVDIIAYQIDKGGKAKEPQVFGGPGKDRGAGGAISNDGDHFMIVGTSESDGVEMLSLHLGNL